MGGVGSGRPRTKPRPSPKHPLVLGGAVKMTPRRYEILSHVLAGALQWRKEPIWSYGGPPREFGWMPYCGGTQINGVLTTLHRLRLVRWQRGNDADISPRGVELTSRGLFALEEYEQATKGVTQCES